MDPFNLSPSSLQGTVLFLLPGYLLTQLIYFQIPDRKKSDLIVVIWSVVASVMLNFLTSGIYSFLNFITHVNLQLNTYDFHFLIARFFLTFTSALLIGKFLRSKFFLKSVNWLFKVKTYPFGRLWNVFFDLPENSVVKVFLNDGRSYIGVFAQASVDPNDEIQEIVLLRPFYFNKKTNKVKLVKEAEKVLIQACSIVSAEKINKVDAQKLYGPAKGKSKVKASRSH